MQVKQAIVTSADDEDVMSTSLMARSLNINNELAETLCRWCPSRNDLEYGKHQALSFFIPEKGTLALARTTATNLGEKTQLSTQIVLLDSEQLAKFDHNAILLAHYLRSAGIWMYPIDSKKGLPMLEIPERANINVFGSFIDEELTPIHKALDVHGKVALLGVINPNDLVGRFLQSTPAKVRNQVSFSIGLRSSESRPYKVQVFENKDVKLSKEIASLGIRTISLETAGTA